MRPDGILCVKGRSYSTEAACFILKPAQLALPTINWRIIAISLTAILFVGHYRRVQYRIIAFIAIVRQELIFNAFSVSNRNIDAISILALPDLMARF